MRTILEFLMVPSVLFLLFVAPLWIIMHYRSKQRTSASLTEVERSDLERLASAAEGLCERVATLESILDAETPEWRQRVEP